MVDRKLSSAIRSASAVNLKYSADLLNLGRDYVRAFSAALVAPDEKKDTNTDAARAPLLLAGRAGETANAAFAISNSGQLSGVVTLQVTGEFADTKVSVEPERLSFDDGDGDRIVRIVAKVGRKTKADADYVGSVVIPELDHRITNFVLRKLPA